MTCYPKYCFKVKGLIHPWKFLSLSPTCSDQRISAISGQQDWKATLETWTLRCLLFALSCDMWTRMIYGSMNTTCILMHFVSILGHNCQEALHWRRRWHRERRLPQELARSRKSLIEIVLSTPFYLIYATHILEDNIVSHFRRSDVSSSVWEISAISWGGSRFRPLPRPRRRPQPRPRPLPRPPWPRLRPQRRRPPNTRSSWGRWRKRDVRRRRRRSSSCSGFSGREALERWDCDRSVLANVPSISAPCWLLIINY